jgi:hypothetical protein
MSHATGSLRPSARATLLDVDPGRFRYSAWNNVSVGVWGDQATLEAAQRVIQVSKWMAQRYPQGHSNVIFVLDGAPAPTPEANQIFSRVYDDKFSDLSCLGIVIEGSGFWASGIRSAITNQRLSKPGRVRVRVSDDLDALIEWFLPEHSARTESKFSVQEFRSALTGLREIAANDNGEVGQLSSPRARRT